MKKPRRMETFPNDGISVSLIEKLLDDTFLWEKISEAV